MMADEAVEQKKGTPGEGLLLSLVVPCFNEAATVEPFVETVKAVALPLPYEICFVDDGSSDETLQKLKALAERFPYVHYLAFSRNFGKEAALLAGLRAAKGDLVVTMDVDLQDPPALLPEMVKAILEEGYDSVATRRTTRAGEPPVRSWCARRFYWLMRHFSEVELVDGARDYRMMTRQVVNAVLALTEVNRFTKGIYQWVGFRTKWLEFEHVARTHGHTKWSFRKLLQYSFEGIIAFSTAPLQLASLLGIVCCILSAFSLLFIVIRALLWGDPVSGWPSMVSIVIFLGGLQLFVSGILGAYLARTYLETKHRPLYIIREQA